jgi:hypothetical protein
MRGVDVLNQQRKSREKLALAAARYASLRAADGPYTDTVRTTLRNGTPVTVLVRLDIVAEP